MTDNATLVVLSTPNGLHEGTDSGVGSSVASSDASTSDEHLQASSTTNPTRIIHLHNNFGHRRLSSPSYSPPVQQFRRQHTPAHMLEYEAAAAAPVKPSGLNNRHLFQEGGEMTTQKKGEKCQSWLLRLFESKMFDASMAVHYLFNSKEPGVLSYLGNRLFTLDDQDVEFYLPQMVNMYVQHHEVAEVIHPYIVHRCR